MSQQSSAVEVTPHYDDSTLSQDLPPYHTLRGETISHIGRTTDGIITLSNFRVYIRYPKYFVNVPLGLIDSIECRDIFYLLIYGKDARFIK